MCHSGRLRKSSLFVFVKIVTRQDCKDFFEKMQKNDEPNRGVSGPPTQTYRYPLSTR
jgi:hypothetical protein